MRDGRAKRGVCQLASTTPGAQSAGKRDDEARLPAPNGPVNVYAPCAVAENWLANGHDGARKGIRAKETLQRLGSTNVTINSNGALKAWRDPNGILQGHTMRAMGFSGF